MASINSHMKLWELFSTSMALDEVLNQPVAWEWKAKTAKSWEAEFVVGETAYHAIFSGPDDRGVEIIFADADNREDITGAGKAFQVFATVAQIIRDFLRHRDPKNIKFSSKEASRTKLYQRLATSLASELGSEVDTYSDDRGQGFKIDLREDGKIIPGVNTTIDVQPGETNRQAAKFGNVLDDRSRPPLLRGTYGDDSARYSANQGDPFYGDNGTRLKPRRQ
jgi:hypothetical protein